jgi:hypothetical protein
MSFIRKKDINGHEYEYEITSYWDKEKQQSRNHSRYVGKPGDSKDSKSDKDDKRSSDKSSK